MSWSPPQCPECSSPATRFESAVPHGPPRAFGLYWVCERCRGRVLELCPPGVDDPRPGGCLNCGAAIDASGICGECGVERPVLVARVHAHCGAPPQLEAIEQVAEQGLFRLAFNAVDLRLEQLPNDAPTLVAKAKLMTAVERPAEAVPLLRRAIELGVDEPGIDIDLGVALAHSGRHEEAIVVYQAYLARETQPTRRALTLSNIGGCLSALGRARQAEDYHRRAVAADPEHLGPRWNLFANLFRNRRYEGALEIVEQTLALPFLEQDERENLQAYRAEVLMAMGCFWDALAAVDLSLASDPNDVSRLICRARVLIHLDLRDPALACIAKVVSLDSDNPIAKLLLERLDRKTAPGSRN
jgi:tetratricopeptide (TPR) repeat protein